jgi:predicted DNA-binding transcriptional regulator YafY
MGRNAQLIRQWAMLKQIETNRWTTIADLAEHHVVSTKTIRRDLAALMEAGFPLYDERYDGKVYWRLNDEYKGLPLATLSLSETAALYFSKKAGGESWRRRRFPTISRRLLRRSRARFPIAILSSLTVWTT